MMHAFRASSTALSSASRVATASAARATTIKSRLGSAFQKKQGVSRSSTTTTTTAGGPPPAKPHPKGYKVVEPFEFPAVWALLTPKQQKWASIVGGTVFVLGACQIALSPAHMFFEHRFVTTKKPEDLADFYGTEDFMELFCVFPFMVNFMMRAASFDDDGTIHAWGMLGPGELEVHIDFDEREEDTTGDGEPDTMVWFQKHERFHDTAPDWMGGFTLWEMVQNFGYRWRPDGTCEIYHQGESFRGFFPMRFVFHLHSYYVIWATEKYVNGTEFGVEDREEAAEGQRQNIPLYEFQMFLEGLTRQVEQAKEAADEEGDEKKQEELSRTLQRLKTVSAMDHTESHPRLRTLQSHKTHQKSVHLVVDDVETKKTIRRAMEQIAEASQEDPGGEVEEPIAVVRTLTRRMTHASVEHEIKRRATLQARRTQMAAEAAAAAAAEAAASTSGQQQAA